MAKPQACSPPRGVKDPRPSHPTMSEIGGNCAQPRSHPTPTTHTRMKVCTWLGAARDEHTVRAGKFALCVCDAKARVQMRSAEGHVD